MPVFADNSLSIGRTPLVRLNRVTAGCHATVLAKVEGRNPAYSVKCRIGASMIWDAEKRGILTPGKRLVEPTSGNTGIALAFVAAARGYPITLTMPDTMSIERRKVLRAFGARLELTEGAKGMKGAIAKAEEIFNSDPMAPSCCSSFRIRPIRRFTLRRPDRRSGTIPTAPWTSSLPVWALAGRSRVFPVSSSPRKARRSRPLPLNRQTSPVITQFRAGLPLQPGPHKIQGIGAGFIPATLDLSLVDRVEQVTSDESMEMARRLAREEGLLSGISCGAAVRGRCPFG